MLVGAGVCLWDGAQIWSGRVGSGASFHSVRVKKGVSAVLASQPNNRVNVWLLLAAARENQRLQTKDGRHTAQIHHKPGER